MRRPLLLLPLLALVATGCLRSFNPRAYSTSAALYQAGMDKFNKKKWGDAATAFERLTLDLPTRDTLLPRAHWYLGLARLERGERLLAAQSFIRLSETLPDDSLADNALFMSGKAYEQLWEKPSLDPQYGVLAQTQFRLLQGVYPDSPMADSARLELKHLDEMFAKKDLETARHYIRRKAYDSAIIFLKDVVKNWPETNQAKLAMITLVEVYRVPALNYQSDAKEVCDALRASYPTDPGVLRTCKVAADSTATAKPKP